MEITINITRKKSETYTENKFKMNKIKIYIVPCQFSLRTFILFFKSKQIKISFFCSFYTILYIGKFNKN